MKSGAIIPAIIMEIGDVELKYKKFAQAEPAGIYSVFISDLASIHYLNGNVVDYTNYVPDVNKKPEKETLKEAGTLSTMRFNMELSGYYCNRNESDNLRLFWRNLNNDNSLDIGYKPFCYSLNIGMGTVMGPHKRTWFGDKIQLIFTPSDAIYATNDYNGGSNEIKLKMFYFNIMFYLGRTLNHKKTLMYILEPGIELGFMSGLIKIHDTNYNVSHVSGICAHLATGFDWSISKRFLASIRVGQRFMDVEEMHESSKSKTGYSSFLVNPPTNNNHVSVNWSGTYFSLGISYCFYTKIKLSGQK